MSAEHEAHPLFLPLVFAGGLLFGFGLGFSHMAQPEVVLSFLQLRDLGLLFVMFGAAIVTGLTFFLATRFLGDAPLTGDGYGRRLKALDRNVLFGGAIFGVGWGLSGICPGAAYASLGIGNLPILWGIAGMFIGAYAQGYVRSASDEPRVVGTRAGDD
ncbi:YeeE/YedE family protein [Natronobeatus ordinarius]|uniref:YeeE/YedE family protein n=1 Tax=Natronobeatus ordinarius TaxID=2963433 RepID=UPI0020CF08DD|nr:DUF6691 family protein [Natronobeatus ordinarius]